MKINLILFTISSPVNEIKEIIKLILNQYPIYLLSPHVAFENEISQINDGIDKQLSFISFYQFISQEEMEFCDNKADVIIVERFKLRNGYLSEYYNQIKALKNCIILKNIKLKFEIAEGYIVADDLGIDASIWLKENFVNKIIGIKKIKNKNNILSKIKRFLSARLECNILKTNNESFYLLGKPDRTLQYLKDDNKLVKLSYFERFLFNNIYKLNILARKKMPVELLINILIKIFKKANQNIEIFITPMHEDRESYSILAKRFGCKYVNLQDGYLPNYYTSTYLKFRNGVDKYYIWDKLSKGIFERHSLSCEKWDSYKSNLLPTIKINQSFEIKKIVFLASGAGDWTALKNRSDEDLIFLALINVSKKHKNIHFIFRPHPLWLHPTHQGVNSIERLMFYVDYKKLTNFTISSGALKEGLLYTKHNDLSTASTTIDDDMNSADIIIGDHSQSILTGAKKGKIIASISLAKRKEFFSNYGQLGFPILKSESDIHKFINIINDKFDRTEFLINYNNAIELYNREYI